MKYIINQYNSVSEFINSINHAKNNKVFSDANLSSQTGDPDFTTTANYQEADKLFKFGDAENMKKMEASGLKINSKTLAGNQSRPQNYNSVVGFCPNVPAYLMGLPCNMINQKRQIFKSSKVITIIYNNSFPFYVSTSSIVEYNTALVNAILGIEAKGYRVNLFVTWASKEGKECAFPLIKVKDSGTKFDKLKLAYPLINPSFSRRHCFRYLETAGITESGFHSGYGYVASKSTIEKGLKQLHIKYDKLITFMDLRDNNLYTPQSIIDAFFSDK